MIYITERCTELRKTARSFKVEAEQTVWQTIWAWTRSSLPDICYNVANIYKTATFRASVTIKHVAVRITERLDNRGSTVNCYRYLTEFFNFQTP